MTKTRQELVNRALDLLGALPAGQSANPEDYTKADKSVETVLSSLATRNIYQWGDPDQVDEDAFEYLAVCLAETVPSIGGRREDKEAHMIAEARLRQLFPTVLSGQTLKAEYF